MKKLKIIVVGPEESGKSLISNIIADNTDCFSSQYEPTQGVRILEIELSSSSHFGNFSNREKIEVELWDCSGSSKYQPYWPVFQFNTDGVVFVYNTRLSEKINEIELFYDYFVVQNGLRDDQCMIIVNKQDDIKELSDEVLSNRFKKMTKKFINAMSDATSVKSDFSNYVVSLSQLMKYESKGTSLV